MIVDKYADVEDYESRINQEVFEEMRSLIRKHGEVHPKKHGNWMIWRFCGGKYFVSLDTWNSNILLKKGSGEYNEWNGFYGQIILNFGIDWGGFEPKNQEKLKTLLEIAKGSIENMDKLKQLHVSGDENERD